MIQYVVSACLAGVPCRYDARHNLQECVARLVQEGRALPLCPEVLAGLPTPRNPVEIQGNCICDAAGLDYTLAFKRGAHLAFDAARKSGCLQAIVKSRSPSCGFGHIYDGTFSKKLIEGNGLWAQLLYEHGFEIYTEENLPTDVLEL